VNAACLALWMTAMRRLARCWPRRWPDPESAPTGPTTTEPLSTR
jgi:hypothetical protein